MIVLIDIGNTRIKWALLENGRIAQQQAVAHATWTHEAAGAAFISLQQPHRVLVGNVGGDRIGAVVRDASIATWGVQPEFVATSAAAGGVRNAYPDPWKLGVDRWLAMIGAYAAHQRAVCVVGVGTAATIDGVDAKGGHLGGVIVPGPDLMVDSLLKNTSGIAPRAQQGSVRSGVFADNTLGAIRQGAVHAVAALAERAVESMQAELGQQPQLVLTGGASEAVGRLIRFPHVSTPDLVLHGLAVIAQTTP